MDYQKFLVKNIEGKTNEALKNTLIKAGFSGVKSVETYGIYCVLGRLNGKEKSALENFLFCNNVVETCKLKEKNAEMKDGFTLEIMLKPGVTDTQSREAMNGIKEMGFMGVKEITSGIGYCISPNLDEAEREKIARFLCNDVIQYYAFDDAVPQFVSQQTKEQLAAGNLVEEYDVANMSDEQLMDLSLEKRAALDLAEMQKIRSYFKKQNRSCTDVEFETIAQTWSEHCVHKTFKAEITIDSSDPAVEKKYPGGKVSNILKTYIKKATDEIATDWVVSSFVDNAGIVKLNDEYDISFKVETHNHPSAIEPFGGANTGVGGVIRDVMGVSARPFAVTDVLCFGNPDMPYLNVPAGSLHPRQIISGVVAGVCDYGNKMGIPNVNGGVHFAEGYTTNPLVYCGCAGIAKHGIHRTQPNAGDLIYTIGAPTGRDAIRGATFSSMIVNASTGTVAGSAVQIGDPIIQRKVSEALDVITERGLYSAITDCGAGGFSSAVGEMSSKLGCTVDLTDTPVKYAGLATWELWVSESQERMVLAVPPAARKEFEAVCAMYEVEFFNLGSFTGDGVLTVKRGGKTVIKLDCDFLHSGPPQRKLTARPYTKECRYKTFTETSVEKMLLGLLSDKAICSRQNIVNQYDYEVQGGAVLRQYDGPSFAGPQDAAVVQPREAKGSVAVAFSNALNFRASDFGAYNMTMATVDEAVRSVIAVGADPERIGILDNYCMGDPKRTQVMWDLIESARACYDAATLFKTPFISGKDSFNNEYLKHNGERVAIPASLLISAMAIVPNIDTVPGSELKNEGNLLYLLGSPDFQWGASVFADCFGIPENTEVKFSSFSAGNAELYKKLYTAISGRLIASCHDISDGGLLVAISEMCIGGSLGARLDLDNLKTRMQTSEVQTLFGETSGCFVIECTPQNAQELEALFGDKLCKLGLVQAKTLSLNLQKENIKLNIEQLQKAFNGKTIL